MGKISELSNASKTKLSEEIFHLEGEIFDEYDRIARLKSSAVEEKISTIGFGF